MDFFSLNNYHVFAVGFFLSLLMTNAFRRFALRFDFIDAPNFRSSHVVNTPRGGGLGFVIVFILASSVFYELNYLSFEYFMSLALSGCIVAGIGLVDDHTDIRAVYRLLVHFFSASWGLFWLGGINTDTLFPNYGMSYFWIINIFVVIYLVWMLNLYNFMDGIDGIAGVQAFTVTLCGSFLLYIKGDQDDWYLPIMLSISIVGFLYWNFPKAKIFMGDVGSGFLGLMIGLFSIQSTYIDPSLFWCWIVLSGVFIVDASVTLLRRIIRRKNILEAHRSHAYQFASRKYKSHIIVTLFVGLINICFLFPVALLIAYDYINSFLGVVFAYIPLFMLVLYFKSGAEELQSNFD